MAGIALAHGDEKVTVCADVTGADGLPLLTVTVTLVVPNAESEDPPTPKIGGEMVRFAAPTANPIDPVTAAVPTCAFAVIVVAPAVAPPVSVIVATPAAFVSAVPEVGIIVAIVDAVLNVTTVLTTGALLASVKVAFTLAEVPLEMLVTGAPETGSVSTRIKLAAAVGVGVPPPPAVVVPLAPLVPPLPHAVRSANVAASKSVDKMLYVFLKKRFCTQGSRSRSTRIKLIIVSEHYNSLLRNTTIIITNTYT